MVAGVVCEDKAGVTRINAKAVVMATGGYGNDEEMMDAFIPATPRTSTTSRRRPTTPATAFAWALAEAIDRHPTAPCTSTRAWKA